MDARLIVGCTGKITDKYVGWMRLGIGHQQPVGDTDDRGR